jgi:hypothetical protein
MGSLSDYTKSKLRSRYPNDYYHDSLSFSTSDGITVVSYDLKHYTYNAGVFSESEPSTHTFVFETNIGEQIAVGKKDFLNLDFGEAREQFDSAYMVAEGGSSEETEAKKLLELTDRMIAGIGKFDSGNYVEARADMDAVHNSANGDMQKAIGRKRNEFAETINSKGLDQFEVGNWMKANELFNEAYLLSTDGYSSKASFENNRHVAAKLKTIPTSNEVAVLEDALNSTQNQRMRQTISIKLANAKEAKASTDVK